MKVLFDSSLVLKYHKMYCTVYQRDAEFLYLTRFGLSSPEKLSLLIRKTRKFLGFFAVNIYDY